MIDSYFRSSYQSVCVNPLLNKLTRLNVSPHMYTWGALLSGLAIIPSLNYQKPWLALCLLLISGFLDTVDGSVARAKNQATPRGAVFDIVSDRIVEIAVILGLFAVDPTSRGLLCLLMLGSAFLCVTTFLVVGIFMQNEGYKSFYYSPGIMERAEAFLFFSVMILFPVTFTPLAILFSILVFTTALVRIWQFNRPDTN